MLSIDKTFFNGQIFFCEEIVIYVQFVILHVIKIVKENILLKKILFKIKNVNVLLEIK